MERLGGDGAARGVAGSFIGADAQLREIEPGLTITKVRRVCAHWPDEIWGRYSEGLRLAGLPE